MNSVPRTAPCRLFALTPTLTNQLKYLATALIEPSNSSFLVSTAPQNGPRFNASYQAFVHELFPNAELIIDRFHIIQLMGRTIEEFEMLQNLPPEELLARRQARFRKF